MRYLVIYKLYGCENDFICETYSQYSNFIYAMEKEFCGYFEVIEIFHESVR